MTTTPRDRAMGMFSAMVLEDGRTIGQAAADFQLDDASAICDPDGPPDHALSRSRGSSKSTDLAAISMALMLEQAPPRARCYAVAADADQAALLLDAARGLAARTPGLMDALAFEARRIVVPASDVRLEVLAADAASSWGLKPWLFVADELANWPSTSGARTLWTSVLSSMPKVPGSRLVVLTTAGDPAHWSAKVFAHARTSSEWRVHEVPGPPPWIAPSKLDEQRRALPDSLYQRLFENRWVAAEDRLVDPEALRECVTLDGPQDARRGVTYRIGVDVGLRHDRTAIAVCHA